MKLTPDQLTRMADVFRAFAEPTRLSILQELKAGERSVSEIVETVASSQANISKQLKVLHDARVLRRRKDGTLVLYSIDDPLVFELCTLVCDKLNRDASKRAEIRF